MAEKTKNTTPVLVALTHNVINADTFTSLADVADAVKYAAARHRIPYDGATVAAALRSVGARRPLLTRSPSAPFHEHSTTGAARILPDSHAHAVAILDRVRARHIVNGWPTRKGATT